MKGSAVLMIFSMTFLMTNFEGDVLMCVLMYPVLNFDVQVWNRLTVLHTTTEIKHGFCSCPTSLTALDVSAYTNTMYNVLKLLVISWLDDQFQWRRRIIENPIRVAKTIDVVSRIVFPTAYAIFLIYFFVSHQAFKRISSADCSWPHFFNLPLNKKLL